MSKIPEIRLSVLDCMDGTYEVVPGHIHDDCPSHAEYTRKLIRESGLHEHFSKAWSHSEVIATRLKDDLHKELVAKKQKYGLL